MITYKVLTILTWLVSVVSTIYYTIHRPHDDVLARHRIWEQNWIFVSGFTLNSVLIDIYWCACLAACRIDPKTDLTS